MDGRYCRQIILPEIKESGQARLSSSKASVIGAGGLGSAVLYYLASAGIGEISIVDPDRVDLTNLNRQFIHNEADIGREKAISAMEKIQSFNPAIKVTASVAGVCAENTGEHLSGSDIVISCVDNKHTRFLLNGFCVQRGVPFVDGGISGFEGYVLTYLPNAAPCFCCAFPVIKESPAPTGVIGAAAGVVGSIMALQAVKILLGIKFENYLLYADLMSLKVFPIEARKNPNCPVCGANGQPRPRSGQSNSGA